MISGVSKISNDIALTRDEKLGFLTFSPVNLGNTIHASVQLKLDKLSQMKEKIDEITDKFLLGISKLSLDDKNNIYEVHSKKKMGLTEFQAVNEFAEGISALINAENSL